jgi:hypothetical protein
MCSKEFATRFHSNAGVHIVAGYSIDPKQGWSVVLVHAGDWLDCSTHIDQNKRHGCTAICSSECIRMFLSNAAVHIVAGFCIIPGQVSSVLVVHQGDRLDPSSHIDRTNTQLFTAISHSMFRMMFQSNTAVHIVAGFCIVPGQVLSMLPVHPGDRLDPSTHIDRSNTQLLLQCLLLSVYNDVLE